MSSLNTKLLSEMIKSKRGGKGLREAGKEIGISAPTLSRIEQEKVPDLETYILLCEWLAVSTDYFVEKSENAEGNLTQKDIVAHLRADKVLDKDVSEALIKMIQIAYESI